MSPDVAVTKRWTSGYWEKWFTALNLLDYSEVDNGGDVFVAEPEEDIGDTFNWIAEVDVSEPDDDNHTWSVAGAGGMKFKIIKRTVASRRQNHPSARGSEMACMFMLSVDRPFLGALPPAGPTLPSTRRSTSRTLLRRLARTSSCSTVWTLESQAQKWLTPCHP